MFEYEIPEELLARHNLTFDEWLYLLFLYRGADEEEVRISLQDKQIVRTNELGYPIMKRRERITVEIILSECKRYIENMKRDNLINPDYIAFAEEMQKLYPQGTRPGCSVKWRGNKLIIAKKLTTLSRDFGIAFTKEQAIDTTRRYVESFNGDYTYMECLEYFILRERPVFKSNFLSYLEDSNESNNNDDAFLSLK